MMNMRYAKSIQIGYSYHDHTFVSFLHGEKWLNNFYLIRLVQINVLAIFAENL